MRKDIPVNEDRWPELIESASFTNMKANAELMAPGASQGLWKDTSDFFHKGTNRRWEGVLNDVQIANYRTLAKAQLAPDLEAWLEHRE
jgi:aryl sulfotransferase